MATLSKRITGNKLQQHHERYINHPTRIASRTMTFRFWGEGARYPMLVALYVMEGRSEIHNTLYAIQNTCEGD